MSCLRLDLLIMTQPANIMSLPAFVILTKNSRGVLDQGPYKLSKVCSPSLFLRHPFKSVFSIVVSGYNRLVTGASLGFDFWGAQPPLRMWECLILIWIQRTHSSYMTFQSTLILRFNIRLSWYCLSDSRGQLSSDWSVETGSFSMTVWGGVLSFWIHIHILGNSFFIIKFD